MDIHYNFYSLIHCWLLSLKVASCVEHSTSLVGGQVFTVGGWVGTYLRMRTRRERGGHSEAEMT